MGYAPEFVLAKPAITFIDEEMKGWHKKKPATTVLGKMGEFFGSLFGSSTNADGTVRKGCFSSLADKVTGWKEQYDDFEWKDLFKKKSKSSIVFPAEEEGGDEKAEGETQTHEDPVFEF